MGSNASTEAGDAAAKAPPTEEEAPKEPPKSWLLGSWVHDIPVTGVFSCAVADNCCYAPPDDELEAAFEKADTKKAGKLTKNEVAVAVRELKKSERQVQKVLDYMNTEDVDLKGFKELLTGEYRPWYYKVWCVPVPNHEKVLDVPVLGHLLCTTGDIVGAPVDWYFRAMSNSVRDPYEWEMEKMFFEMDKDRKGVLNTEEVKALLRKFGSWEVDIEKSVKKLRGKDPNVYEFKELMRGKKFSPSFLHSVPVVGMPLSNNITRYVEPQILTDKDIQLAFDQVDKASVNNSRNTGTLNKTQVAECLFELGVPESRVQAACDSMEEDEELDLEGFKAILAYERPRTWTKTITLPNEAETEITVPNPFKIHDAPLVGTATKFTQDVLYDSYDWTFGTAYRTVGLVDEVLLLKQFNEIDKNGDGKINRVHMSKLLRTHGMREFEIQELFAKLDLDKDALTFEDFRDWVYGVYEDDPIKEYAAQKEAEEAEAKDQAVPAAQA